MGDSTRNTYYSSGSSRIPHSRHPSGSDEQNTLPHLLAPLPYEPQFHPYLGAGENVQNISVQFMNSCPRQDTTQPDSDILQRRPTVDHESPHMPPHPTTYSEPPQRATSPALSPYAADASGFLNYSPCDLSALHIVDAPLHGVHAFRRGSWPSHSQTGYSPWTHSLPRMMRSPASEPPESTSDESYQDSDVEEGTQMSPMMNQFQIQSSRNVNLPPHDMYHAHALQPSVMTFQLSETMLQPVDDPENRHMLHSLLGMNIMADGESEDTHPSSSSTFPSSSSVSFRGARIQGPSTRLRHDNERVTATSQLRVPASSPSSIPFPPLRRPTNPHVGDPRASGSKPQKKSKMHQCKQCKKMFPRPSGLATHMNSHSGAKPFKCMVADCEKSFAVRSNAKRHLRTHGINPSSSDVLSAPRFTVGFEAPVVTQVHDVGRQPARYRWMPHNQSLQESEWVRQGASMSAIDGGSRTGLTFQTSTSSATSSTLSNGSDDDRDEVASPRADDYTGRVDEFSGIYPNYNYRDDPR